MAAPVVAITAYDEKFYEHLPFLMPACRRQAWFSGNPSRPPAAPSRTAPCRSPISSSRCARVGLDTGPMTGFDNAKVDAEFFPEGHVKSNVLINIGYGDASKLFPRSPRLSFDQMAKIL